MSLFIQTIITDTMSQACICYLNTIIAQHVVADTGLHLHA